MLNDDMTVISLTWKNFIVAAEGDDSQLENNAGENILCLAGLCKLQLGPQYMNTFYTILQTTHIRNNYIQLTKYDDDKYLRLYSPPCLSIFSPSSSWSFWSFAFENPPLKSRRNNSLSMCLRTSPSLSSPFTPLRRINVWWKLDAFAMLALTRIDLDASFTAVNGCWDVDKDNCS